jgi:predicted nucleotide-binding protein
MYFHVVIETNEKVGKNERPKRHIERDHSNLDTIKKEIVRPFLAREQFQVNGYFLDASRITRLAIFCTNRTSKELSDKENREMPENVIMYISPEDVLDFDKYTTDITRETIEQVKLELKQTEVPAQVHPGAKPIQPITTTGDEVFIVHGHDAATKNEVARFVERAGLKATILHEQPNFGRAIIEKFEEHASQAGFAIILLTPDDVGGEGGVTLKPRARQNVIAEMGYFAGKLGRRRVCVLMKGTVEVPSDFAGVVYTEMDDRGAWKGALGRELQAAGYAVDWGKALA